MAVDHVKSPSITNLDASPAITNTAGEGAAGLLKCVTGWATAVANSTALSTYQFVRVPSSCKIKMITFESGAQTGAGAALDLGLYYSTDGEGGRPLALLSTAAISLTLFASAIAVTNLVVPTDVTNESGTFTSDMRNMPLWQAAGLSSDPGGHFDIVGTTQTTWTTGTGKFGINVFYND